MGEIYIFTASHKEYADKVLSFVDRKGFISKRFYRQVKFISLNVFLLS